MHRSVAAYRRPADTTEGTGRALEKSGAHISGSVAVAYRYGVSCDITLELRIIDAPTNRSGMDTSSVEAFTRNGPSKRWTITWKNCSGDTRRPILC